MTQKTDNLIDPTDYANMPDIFLEQLAIQGNAEARQEYNRRNNR